MTDEYEFHCNIAHRIEGSDPRQGSGAQQRFQSARSGVRRARALSHSALAGPDRWRSFCTMTKISYAGYRFPPEIIQQAIWLYVRFTLSFRDVKDLFAERGITVSYETVRRWVNHFGLKIAAAQTPTQTSYDLASRRILSEDRWPHGLSVARRGRRRRSSRCAGPEQEKQASGTQIDAQAFEEIWRCPREARHG